MQHSVMGAVNRIDFLLKMLLYLFFGNLHIKPVAWV